MTQVPVRNFETWRDQARKLLAAGIAPDQVHFVDEIEGQPTLWADQQPLLLKSGQPLRVPKQFLDLARTVACHRDPDRWDLLYQLLWRLTHGEPGLLHIEVDPIVRRMAMMQKAVGRDIHKMRAFVRFREVRTDQGLEYVAWYRPDHHIVAINAPFFVRRFGSMRWAILTPDQSAYWDGVDLRFGPGAPRSAAPEGDALEDLWRAYYASVYNPARLNLKAMRAEMPARHWATLPEAQMISQLAVNSSAAVDSMLALQPQSAQPWIPVELSNIEQLRDAGARCQGCELYRQATHPVFGEGPADAQVVLVGEQPGDEEDHAGRPFVGPAGRLLDRALADVGVNRSDLYITNAVKHFKFEERGKRRIHKKPSGDETSACRPWLEAELSLVEPRLIVALGGTAAQSLLGRDVRILRERGKVIDTGERAVLVTLHPAALLRLPDSSNFDHEYARWVADLFTIRRYLQPHSLAASA